jgi:tRNA (guanine37-N1)-methyltransferase
MRVGIISLFPEMFMALDYGIIGKAITKGLLQLQYWNPRNYAKDKHRTVDDRPYGGGPGMVMKVQPLRDAIMAAKSQLGIDAKVIHLSPQGKLLTQEAVVRFATENKIILVASRYEGIDERLLEGHIDEEWSIGDYVLTGGELAAMVMIDAIARLLPGVLGHQDSAHQDSFMKGLVDYPHFTRPKDINGQRVPNILLQGNHKAIAEWRLKQALGRTWLRRSHLLVKRLLTEDEQKLLADFIREYKARGKNS